MGELAPRSEFPDVLTGEVLPATAENAYRALTAVDQMQARLRDVRAAITDFMVEEAKRQGTKTFHTTDGDVSVSGGVATEIDAQTLAQLLREAGCPEERIDEVVVAHIEYKVNRNVLRQLTGANSDYKAAADLATHEVEKPWRASAK
jgi:hypothetical protein